MSDPLVIKPLPTAGQLDLMNKNWSQANINEENNPGTIGMYGTDEKYYFYMKFTCKGDDLWH